MKRINIAVVITILTEFMFVKSWFACKALQDFFYFSLFDIQLIITGHIHADTGVPLLLTRIVHNKISVTAIEFFRHYAYFWDVRFLLPLLSPIGVFSVIAGIWYLANSKIQRGKKIAIFIILLGMPIVEMVVKPQLPFPVRIILLSLPLIVLSGYGIFHFFNRTNRAKIAWFVTVALLSIWWYYVFHNEFAIFCVAP